jgi:hypothetical protein
VKKIIVFLLLVLFIAASVFTAIPVHAAAPPVVDGIISPGEYDGGMNVQLIGPYPPGTPLPPETTNAYIYWDLEYLWIAVDEPVPAGSTGTSSWIEFAMDAGPTRPVLDGFVLFCSGNLQYGPCPKPTGSWSWGGPVPSGTGGVALYPYPWWAVTGTATEFKVKYTDYGIAPGDTIKMVIDRGKEDSSYPPPLGDCVVWPPNPTFYPSVTTSDLATWGDVTLDHAPPPPPPPTHVIDGIIGSGEYDGGMSIQLVGQWDPLWTVDAYIDWDAEYLYVAVNEHVPATTGHKSWIEWSIDAGPARPYLDAFQIFDDHVQSYMRYTKPAGPWGVVPGSFQVVSNIATEFKVKCTDFGIALGGTIKMEIDRNHGPAPPLPYGQAAFWPKDARVYVAVPETNTWGDVTLTPPPPPSVSLTVVSDHDSPNPSGTTPYTPGTSVTASITSPVAGPTGYQYVCTGWTGTGDVPSSGTETTVTFTINQDSGITWNWKEQTYLTVKTDPPGIATIPGEGWYDIFTAVTLTAPPVPGYDFAYWDFNGVSQGSGVNPITVQVKCVATAHYTAAPPPVSLTVVSAYDSPSPSGTTSYTPGTSVTASVTSPETIGGTRYVCTGWTGTGSVPSSGSGTTVTFTINQDSGITWLWKTQYYLTVTSAYDTPTGQGWYDANTPVTSSVDLMVHVGSNFYKCTGWTGTGSAPASGTGNTVSFTITQASSVTWKWGSSVGGEWFPATTLPTVAPSNVLQLLAPWIVLAFVAASVFAAYRKLFKKRW